MNILLTIHHELNPNAGAPGSILKLGEAYQALGHTVQYYSFDSLPHWVPKPAQGLLFPEFLANHLTKLDDYSNLDIIDASTGDAWVWAKFFHNRYQKTPLLVTHCHGLEHTSHLALLEEVRQGKQYVSWKYPIYHGGYRLWEVATSLRHAELVLMLNRRDADFTVETFNIEADRVRVIANGIPEVFLNLPLEIAPEGQDSVCHIALVGTYIPRKGIQYSVPALNTILNRYPQVKVSFLGTCCPAEQVYADFDPAIRDRVHVVSRYCHEDLPSLIKDHHILLFPSLSEGFPLAVPEAMACGLAPAVTNIPGATEIVMHKENGVLFPACDSQAIEQTLNQLICDRVLLNTLRQNAHATAQNYSWMQIAQTRLLLYENALKKRQCS